MDILHLIDRLEELFNESKPIWFTHSVIVDEDRMLDIIDQMRVSIPEEIKKSQQINAQHDRILAQAQEKADRILQLAREKGDQLLQQESLIQSAQTRAEQIIAQAREESEATRRESDEYVIETLTRLQDELQKTLGQVSNGILALQQHRKKGNE